MWVERALLSSQPNQTSALAVHAGTISNTRQAATLLDVTKGAFKNACHNFLICGTTAEAVQLFFFNLNIFTL